MLKRIERRDSGEMAQWLEQRLLLQRTWVQIPVLAWWLNTCNKSSRDLMASSDLFWQQAYMSHNTCIQVKVLHT